MEYTINEYVQLKFSDPVATRVEVYPNNQTAAKLLKYHIDNGDAVVSISDCLIENVTVLPMPGDLLRILDEKIAMKKKRTVIKGIEGYLSLLSEENVAAFFVALRGRLDNSKLNAVYMISRDRDLRFEAPRYEESLQVIRISGGPDNAEPLKVIVVPKKWMNSVRLQDFKALLKQLGDFIPAGEYNLALDNIQTEQAGLSKSVSFMLDIRQIAEYFYGIFAEMTTGTLQLLLEKANEKSLLPEVYLESEFGKGNIDILHALSCLLTLPNDILWPAYIWLLKRRLPVNTYMGIVLSANPGHDDLLRKYVVDTAISLAEQPDVKTFAEERARAIKQLPRVPESLIVEFIGQTQAFNSASEFLNCGTSAEMQEVIRRAAAHDLVTGLPNVYGRLCPLLDDYLAEYDYGDKDLTAYFKEYRRFKVRNEISEEFVKRAYDFALPAAFPNRDAILLELSRDSDMALLVVDGMGAEYYPLLLAMAARDGMMIDSHSVVSVKLPTSTEFNPLKWDAERTLEEVREIDNIAHNGAAKHEHCLPERNLAAVLQVFRSEILPRVTEGLTKFSRVIVTSDHGSSRLAVIAHNNGFGTTLPWKGEPLDWRYSVAQQGETRPLELESRYSEIDRKTYWIVRGYNRLPKKGGKLNELHGGASLEERLVPIIIFSRVKSVKKTTQFDKKKKEQLVDRMGFDI